MIVSPVIGSSGNPAAAGSRGNPAALRRARRAEPTCRWSFLATGCLSSSARCETAGSSLASTRAASSGSSPPSTVLCPRALRRGMGLSGRFVAAEAAALAIAVGPELLTVVSRVPGLNAKPTATRGERGSLKGASRAGSGRRCAARLPVGARMSRGSKRSRAGSRHRALQSLPIYTIYMQF